MSDQGQRGNWGSRVGFILAATGSAIGLGNLWKFPYITLENGGGAFVIVYLIAIAIIGFPIMVGELVAGKASQKNPWGAFKELSAQGQGPLAKLPWVVVGGLGILAGFIILSYYAVVAGWTIEYAIRGLTGQFHGQTAAQMGKSFVSFLKNPYKQVFYQFLFMGLTMGIVVMGVSKGIERATRILMPILFGLIVLIVFYSASVGAFGKSLGFLFTPNFSKLTGHGALEAVGHAFFTLSLGMGAMLTYGSYLRHDDDVVKPAITITFFDTLVAFMACLMIYPIVFGSFGLGSIKGLGVLFTSLPVVFMKMPLGSLIAPVFFLLVAFAALSSTISLLEVVVSYGVDERGWNRQTSTLLVGGSIFAFGIPSALSNGGVEWITKIKIFTQGCKKLGWFDSFDYLASNWMLPLGGMFLAIFMGWVVDQKLQEAQEPDESQRWVIRICLFFLRFVSPVAVFVVLLGKIGVFDEPKKCTPKKAAKKAAKKAPKANRASTAARPAPKVRAKANVAAKKQAKPGGR